MTSPRRIGTVDSKTRAKLLDAAERLMIDEGYPAVTSRRLGQEVGMSNKLVHYYFRTMDDLFLEVFRRRAEEGFARFEQAVAADPTLGTIWAFRDDGPGAIYHLEFAALANHHKAIRLEIARYSERFRTMQLGAVERALEEQEGPLSDVPPEVVLLVMTGVSQVMAIEHSLGITTGHRTTVDFFDDLAGRSGGLGQKS
jgi:AcrR family transcriptional regulator